MKLFSSKYSDSTLSFGLLLLRLTVGGLIIPIGYNKLIHFSSMKSQFVDPFHIGMTASLGLTVFAEFFCGILVTLGLLTRFATIPLIVVMATAIIVAHKGDILGEGGHAAMFLGGYLTLLFTGPGKFSLDRVIGK
jgi:putative oxidoreductase